MSAGSTSSMDRYLSQQAQAQAPPADQASAPPAETPAATLLVEIPVAAVPETAWGLHINVQLSSKQSLSLRRVTAALDRQQATLASGERVTKPGHAFKYLLELLAAEG